VKKKFKFKNGKLEIFLNLKELRERIAESLLKMGYCFKYDLTLPLSHFYDIVPDTRKRVGDLAKYVCGYGHVGEFLEKI
jgi:hypothetical protein